MQHHLETKMRDVSFIIKNNERSDDTNKNKNKFISIMKKISTQKNSLLTQ